jgi:hypothetical protein
VATRNQQGSYRYSYELSTTACGVLPITSRSDVVVQRRLSSGDDGRGRSRVPKFNAYSYTHRDEETGSCSASESARDWLIGPCGGSLLDPFEYSVNRTLTDSYPLTGAFSDQARRNVFHKFVDRIGKAQKSIQGLVSIGEAKETFAMLRSPLRSLVDVTTRYVRSQVSPKNSRNTRKRPSKREAAAALNAAYLEYTFGVAPILSDIKGLTKAYYKSRDDYTVVKRVQARASEEVTTNSDDGVFSFAAGLDARRETTTVVQSKLQYITYLTASSPMSPGESPFLRELGLTTSDFVPSVLELIPWYFVLNYFVGIGDFLNREVSISRNWNVLACVSEHNVSTRTQVYSGVAYGSDPYPSSGYYGQKYNFTPSAFRTISGTRSIHSIGSIAQDANTSNSVHIKIPGWRQELNLASLGAAFALSKQSHPLTQKQRALFGVR